MTSQPPPPPSIPPRPSRSKSPLPDIPPRPPRSKTPPEPTLTTIPVATTLHAPIASRPPARITDSSSSSVRNEGDREHGIPQIGRRVPMYPNAGDVQAPTPTATPGGGRRSHVYREEWEKDEGAYGGSKRDHHPYSMSTEDLNLSVAHASAIKGVGTHSDLAPVPDEEIGYLASEEYSRAISPQPSRDPTRTSSPMFAREDSMEGERPTLGRFPTSTSLSSEQKVNIHLDAPNHGHAVHYRGNSNSASTPLSAAAGGILDEGEDEGETKYPILAGDEVKKREGKGEHMAPAVSPPLVPRRPGSRVSTRPASAAIVLDEDADVEPQSLLEVDESREDLLEPVEEPEPLFSDSEEETHETVKKSGFKTPDPDSGRHFPSKDIWEEAPESFHLSATVSTPANETEETEEDREAERTVPQQKSKGGEGYVQGQPHDHYEPGDEKEFQLKEKGEHKGDWTPKFQNERDDGLDKLLRPGSGFKESEGEENGRRSGGRRKFPSKDIWEDAPPSLQLSTTVSDEPTVADPESPTVTSPKDRATTSAPDDTSDTRATTGAPIEGPAYAKPEPPARPSIPPTRPLRKLPPAAIPPAPERPHASVSTSPTVLKNVPPPFSAEGSTTATTATTSQDKKNPPLLPDRPKPKIPARPAGRPLSARYPPAQSPEDKPPVPLAKPKPQVPPRTGGKISALKSGFLGDLENRLKLGPQGPKKEEPAVVEKESEVKLADVRKGRAKGPRGRKLPTKEKEKKLEEEPVAVEKKAEVVKSEVVGVWTVWSVGVEGEVDVLTSGASIKEVKEPEPPATAPATVPKEEPEKITQEKPQPNPVPTPEETPLPQDEDLSPISPTPTQSTSPSSSPKSNLQPPSPPVPLPEEEREEVANKTLIPGSEHPEDAVVPVSSVSSSPMVVEKDEEIEKEEEDGEDKETGVVVMERDEVAERRKEEEGEEGGVSLVVS